MKPLPTSGFPLTGHANVTPPHCRISAPARHRSDMSSTYVVPVDHSQAATSPDDIMLTSPDPDPT